MTAYLSNFDDRREVFGPPPIIVIADSDEAYLRAVASIDGLKIRIVDRVPVTKAVERLDQQVAATAVWLELEDDGGSTMDRLLARVSHDVSFGRYAAIVSAPADLIDVVSSQVSDDHVEQVYDASEMERAAALAIALAVKAQPLRVSDIKGDDNAERLRQLSDEVNRIASTLARLSTGVSGPTKLVPVADVPLPDVSTDLVRNTIRARRLREQFFPQEIFADPAWDMLLDLFLAELAQLRVTVTSLCIAAAVPPTTALRWIKTMTGQGMFVRRADPHDARRVFVELSEETSRAMRRYFGEAQKRTLV